MPVLSSPPPAVAALGKHPAFIYRQVAPPNGGPPPELLRDRFVTPAALFYVRNHGPVPALGPADYRLTVGGLVGRPRAWSLAELRREFAPVTVTATLQCAGNRREDLRRVAPIPGEVPFGGEAISTAVWTGVRLRDLAAACGGLTPAAAHVEFVGLDQAEKDGKRYEFGGSVPREKALSEETLLAYEMNGAPLPPVHGFPLRAVVPGYIGARSVKWLGRITALAAPSTNQFQAKQYRLFPAAARPDTVDWGSGWPLAEVPVNSYVCRVAPGGDRAPTIAEGWAVVGGGRVIARVEVSADGGTHWTQARLLSAAGAGSAGEGSPPPAGGPGADPSRWAWRFWSAELPPGGPAREGRAPEEVVVRAWDSGGNVQPEQAAQLWNFKGYANNAWHRWRPDPSPAGEPFEGEIEYFI